MHSIENIRNFCIIAHIDHGKSTLADRILELTHAIQPKMMKEQVLDTMELERERGITIKAKAVRLNYKNYILNLIDTPGHVDFTYEVSKSLSSCEGAILVIDAVQGVEAQTVANLRLARENNLKIIPVINKIDLPSANPDMVKQQIKDILKIEERVILASAKLGIGIKDVIETIISDIPSPKGNENEKLKALIFDSIYDPYKGVIIFVRLFDGLIKPKMKIMMFQNSKVYEVIEVGVFTLDMHPVERLSAGEVGYIVAGVRNPADVKIGDTITNAEDPINIPLPGYKEMKSMVFCGLHPVNSGDYKLLKDALEKLKLTDGSLVFEPEHSLALGPGFRCGFLGLLHMEITQERLEREFNLDLVITTPTVVYLVEKKNKEKIRIDNPAKLPKLSDIERILEPYVISRIITPSSYIGEIIKLCEMKRGVQKNIEYLSPEFVILTYEFPFAEIIFDFYDKLKSCSKGYASFDYDFIDYRESDLVKIDIFVAGEIVDALSFIVPRVDAYHKSKKVVEKLKEIIPRHMFEVIIQAGIGNRIIAKERIPPLRKDVTAPLYGGDVTRKIKLLEKQKKGKKRMKQFGKVEIPQEAFLAVLRME